MGGWGCPHERNGKCVRLGGVDCDPGRKGCILQGRYRFSNDDKNRLSAPRAARGASGAWSMAMTHDDDGGAPEDDAGSPPCMMHEADDAYMGFAAREEILGFLGELLAAERAGARVCHESLEQANADWMADLLGRIKRDEGRWCAMLSGHITALGAVSSDTVGAFRDKAMAIADPGERLEFLNRGQGWVVRKLREMLPRVRDDRLHRDLSDMLRAHEANIELTRESMAGRG